MAEKEQVSGVEPLSKGMMTAVARQKESGQEIPSDIRARYNATLNELGSEPVIKSAEVGGENLEITHQDLKDAAKILGEDKIEFHETEKDTPPKIIDAEFTDVMDDEKKKEHEPEVETPTVIDDEVREIKWDDSLDRDLRVATREPRRWVDSRDHSKGELSDTQKVEDKRKVNEAMARLGTRGYDVHILRDRLGRARVANARRIITDGRDATDFGMTNEEAEKIFDEMNIDARKAREEGEKRRAEPRPTVDRPGEDPPRADERKGEPRAERGPKRNFNVNNKEDLDGVLAEISGIDDLSARARRLGKLADQMFDEGHNDWGNLAAAKRTELSKKERSANIIGLPENRDSLTEWRQWLRARMAGLLNLSARESGKNTGNIFSVVSETPFGRQNTDGTLYMPKELGDEVYGKVADDGGILEQGELLAANEIGKLYEVWRKAHRKMKGMVEAFERGDYKLPSNDLNKFLLNQLMSEDGVDKEGGSKNIAKALRIYWAMAHNKEEEGQNILYNEGLEEIKSLFNNQLNDAEIGSIRGQIAEKCGGTFYENIGLMYAGFFGVTAYGSDNTAPGIQYADAMGLMIHTEIQRYSKNVVGGLPVLNEADRLSAGKRATRYLDDTVANALVEYTWDGKPKIVEVEFLDENKITRRGKDYIPVSLGKHSGNIQSQKDAKQPEFFYVIKERGVDDKYKIAKRIDDSPGRLVDIRSEDPDGHTIKQARLDTARYEETSLDTLIKQGRINEIDWGNSVDLAGLTALRERGATALFKLYKNLEDDLTKLTKAELVAKKETFEDSMPEHNRATIQHSAYLWLYSLIAKNRLSWTREEKKNELNFMVKDAVETKLISIQDADKLSRTFDIGNIGGMLRPFKDGSYTPIGIVKSLLGQK